MTFRKNINAYIKDEMDDEVLCEFLHHLEQCKNCKDELEINYIVVEGVNILDEKKSEYNLSKAYNNMVKSADRYIKNKKKLLILRYAVDTVKFWVMVTVVFLFIRIILYGG